MTRASSNKHNIYIFSDSQPYPKSYSNVKPSQGPGYVHGFRRVTQTSGNSGHAMLNIGNVGGFGNFGGPGGFQTGTDDNKDETESKHDEDEDEDDSEVDEEDENDGDQNMDDNQDMVRSNTDDVPMS